MIEHEEIAPCISLYKNVVRPDDASLFLRKLEMAIDDQWEYPDLKWENAAVGGGSVTSYRTSVNCSMITLMKPFPETAMSVGLDTTITSKLQTVYADYCVNNLIPNGMHEPFQVLKYFPGAEYHAHWDHYKTNSRVFSLVASLKEADDGGELEFPKFNVKIKLEAGSVILFPSNFPYIHIAHPVVSGTKVSMVTWFS